MKILYRLLFLAALAAYGATACAATELKIPTNKGFVAFTVEGEWPVLSMQMQLPLAAAAFRIPNPADAGTPDSTNIVIALYDPRSKEGRTAFNAPLKQYGGTPAVVEAMGPWTLTRQEARQGDTAYTIWDAKRSGVADVSVSVRLVWPHLAANAPDYDLTMETVFRGVLQSIHGGTSNSH